MCWPAKGQVHAKKDQNWHMEILSSLARRLATPDRHNPTRSRTVCPRRPPVRSYRGGRIDWEGGEEMAVKPLQFVTRNKRGLLVQPAMKCKEKSISGIIYGIEYTRRRISSGCVYVYLLPSAHCLTRICLGARDQPSSCWGVGHSAASKSASCDSSARKRLDLQF